ncbi:fungal-specific transcription factor domain-containing protein [Mycena galopus ATCC 62051]|nr:fungal-specific transcription factor domain-containing protein [Mycena galopus ATCC 62051]
MSRLNAIQTQQSRFKRPCDVCRRRKTGCYGLRIPGKKCNTCIEGNLDCTFRDAPQKHRSKTYVEKLQAKLRDSEALAHELRTEVACRASGRPFDSAAYNNLDGVDGFYAWLSVLRTTIASSYAPPPPPDANDALQLDLSNELEKLSLGPMEETAFIGNSSGAHLVKAATALKESLASNPPTRSVHGDIRRHGWTSRRLDYWTWRPWQRNVRCTHKFRFPSEPLMTELIHAYFKHQQIYLPLLHRPTFERGVSEDLHLRDPGFAATVLLVCAIGSRWSTDFVAAGADFSRGREWFDQVQLTESRFIGPATLYDLQYYCLAVFFLDRSSDPQACSTLIAIGLRLAQDIGVHVRKTHTQTPSAETELYKRAFWILVYLDRITSAEMGRNCALQDSECDTDPLLEVDDEYWDHPVHPFQQPPGVPSRITFFNALMRINHMLGFVLKGLYSCFKLFAALSISASAWEEYAVAELDSALNAWHAHIPAHLRWDPTCTSTRPDQPVFFDQSVALHCAYFHLQIFIHRTFASPFRHDPNCDFSPFATICTNAARACAAMIDVQRRCNGDTPVIFNLRAVFASGHTLLLHVWNGKRTGVVLPEDQIREMTNVYKCMEVMSLCASRWRKAGKLWNILVDLASIGGLPVQDNLRPSLNPTPPNGNGAAGEVDLTIEPTGYTPSEASLPNAAQAARELEEILMLNEFDNDPTGMWTGAPIGADAEAWRTYLSSFTGYGGLQLGE